MPPRKRASSMLNGDARTHLDAGLEDEDHVDPDDASDADDALSLADEAEADAAAAEAEAAAARARARALRLRRQAAAAAKKSAPAAAAAPVEAAPPEAAPPEATPPETAPEATTPADSKPAPAAVPAPEVADPAAVEPAPEAVAPVEAVPVEAEPDSIEDVAPSLDGVAEPAEGDLVEEPARRRRFPAPRSRLSWLKWTAVAVAVLVTLGFLGASGYMIAHHRRVEAEQQRTAEFEAAARQGVVTLMSLNFNSAKDDVKRILDNTTGDFKKDFASQADEFAKVAQTSQVITEATVNATAVQTMTQDTATVLVAVTTQVSNAASKQQQPRSWRLRVDLARDGEQFKLAKVEFVP